jgi:phosphoserine phosphatase
MYRALALDVCGVLTTHKSVWQFIHEELGLWEGTAVRFQEEFIAGAISYREFCERDAALWAGKSVEELAAIVSRLPYREGIGELFETARRLRLKTALISTGLTLLTDRIRADFGVDYAVANRLITADGVFTGGVEVLVPHDGKGKELIRFARRVGAAPLEVIAVGDGSSDVPMFREAGYAVGFGPAAVGIHESRDIDIDESLPALAGLLTGIVNDSSM